MYVYILRALSLNEHYYVGKTNDLKKRLAEHNAGQSSHTSRHRPWKIKNAFYFEDEQKAHTFEKYLKSSSGRAFSKKHF